jgi:hypothetical protein
MIKISIMTVNRLRPRNTTNRDVVLVALVLLLVVAAVVVKV